MKSLKWIRSVRITAVLLLGMFSLAASAAMPDGEYACKVVTIGGQLGQAFTFDNSRGTATSVVECIERGKEQFADYQFQQFFESIPL